MSSSPPCLGALAQGVGEGAEGAEMQLLRFGGLSESPSWVELPLRSVSNFQHDRSWAFNSNVTSTFLHKLKSTVRFSRSVHIKVEVERSGVCCCRGGVSIRMAWPRELLCAWGSNRSAAAAAAAAKVGVGWSSPQSQKCAPPASAPFWSLPYTLFTLLLRKACTSK